MAVYMAQGWEQELLLVALQLALGEPVTPVLQVVYAHARAWRQGHVLLQLWCVRQGGCPGCAALGRCRVVPQPAHPGPVPGHMQ
jgi:hypothetical protein